MRQRNEQRRTRSGGRRVARRLDVERLEERTLLANLDIVGTQLTYTALAGEANVLSVSLDPVLPNYVLDDPGNAINFGLGAILVCFAVDIDTASCPAASVSTMVLNTDDGDDMVNLLVPASPSTTVNGGDGDDQIRVVPVTTAATVDGGAGTDSLVGPDTVNTWKITGMGVGNALLSALGFAGIEDLTGGSDNDTFAFANGASVSGFIEGQGGTDTLNLGAYLTARDIRLDGLSAFGGFFGRAGIAFFNSIESLAGGNADDSLFGLNANADWGIDGTNTYTAGGQTLGFSSFENLAGGPGNDAFVLADGQFVAGTVNGMAGNDTLQYGHVTPVTVNLPTGEATGIRAGFVGSLTSIETVIGGAGDDTIIGQGVAQRLEGGAGNDTITGGAADDTMLGSLGNDVLNGGAGVNWVLYTFSATPVKLNLQKRKGTGEGTDTLIGFSNVIGSPQADSITGTALANILSGGGGNDTIKGGAGDDLLIGGAGNDMLSDKAGRNILIGGLDADILTGGSGDDILIGGRTAAEFNDAVLLDLTAEWSTLVRVYATRVQNLRDGTGSPDRLNGVSFLSPATVFDDAAADRLSGKKGLDWFLGRTAGPTLDVLVDRALATETLDEI